jgi:hypothetical protein
MHHFTRANNLLDLALGHRKNDLEATIYKYVSFPINWELVVPFY